MSVPVVSVTLVTVVGTIAVSVTSVSHCVVRSGSGVRVDTSGSVTGSVVSVVISWSVTVAVSGEVVATDVRVGVVAVSGSGVVGLSGGVVTSGAVMVESGSWVVGSGTVCPVVGLL